MSDIYERTEFERLPPEVIDLIFNYLTGNDVLQSFLYLNTRCNSLIKNLRLRTIDLSRWTQNEIIYLFKNSFNYISTTSLSLKLSNKHFLSDYCSAYIEFIFTSLMDSSQLNYLIKNLQQLIFIRPIIETFICLPDILLQSFIIYSFKDKIIFRKILSQQNINSIMICSNEVMRSSLADNGGIYNQILGNFQNPVIKNIIPFVRHLKLYIDNYDQQWIYMSPLIVNTLSELTLIITDNQFEYYNGYLFSSLLQNISNFCQLHFYLQFIPKHYITTRDIDTLVESFQDQFYTQHQSNVTIAYCRNYSRARDHPLLIYTSPFCASKLTLIDNPQIIGVCTNYTNLTQLILDPCLHNNDDILPFNNHINSRLPNLTSVEFIHTPSYDINQMMDILNNVLQELTLQIHHIHIHDWQCSSYLIKYILPLYSFNHLRYLDITDNNLNCLILRNILGENNFCSNILYLNITGLCRLQNNHIEDISIKCSKLQTLKFSIKFISLFNEQLDTIGKFILINMHSHLHYVHIYFEQENLLIIPMTPTETQLSEWLGYNQNRLAHVQAIELNRNELTAWM